MSAEGRSLHLTINQKPNGDDFAKAREVIEIRGTGNLTLHDRRSLSAAILVDPQVKPLPSDGHFSVDGTMIEAWATLAKGSAKRSLLEGPEEGSMKSFKPKDGSGDAPAPGRNGRSTSAASRAATRHTPRPLILTPGSIRKRREG